MKFRLLFSLLFMLVSKSILEAQELRIFSLIQYEIENKETVGFISLSDAYDRSNIPDSIAAEKGFLFKAKISETDKVFIYNYATSLLKVFNVKDLKLVSYNDIYGSCCMTGFVIDEKKITGFDNYDNIFVYVGKENPFVQEKLKRIVWEKIAPDNFPSTAITLRDNRYFKENEYITRDPYKFETKALRYYIQDLIHKKDDWHFGKRLIVIDNKTNDKIFETIYYAGESASFADLNEQWTGELFKNKPVVIFGFQLHSFGCPSIQFLSASEKEIYLYCDNNH